MTRIRTSAPIDPNDRLAAEIKALRQQVAELQLAASTPRPQTDAIAFSPGGDTDATSAMTTMTTWITVGNVTAPAWATAADCVITLAGIYDVTAANNQFNIRLRIGTANGRENQTRGVGINVRYAHTFSERITLAATGTLSLVVQAQHSTGTGALRMGTVSDVAGFITWRP